VAGQNATLTVHILEYEAVRDRMLALEKERDEWQDRCRQALAERDEALDVIEAVRSIASRQSTTLWSRKVLAALAQLVAGERG
jgi:hypothetical protein